MLNLWHLEFKDDGGRFSRTSLVRWAPLQQKLYTSVSLVALSIVAFSFYISFEVIGTAVLCLACCTPGSAMKVKILQWHAIASWTWDAQDETCGICRMAFDGCCPDCKFPGDDCPLIWGACNHAYHLHCILKWVNSQTSTPLCPMCRREWQFKG